MYAFVRPFTAEDEEPDISLGKQLVNVFRCFDSTLESRILEKYSKGTWEYFFLLSLWAEKFHVLLETTRGKRKRFSAYNCALSSFFFKLQYFWHRASASLFLFCRSKATFRVTAVGSTVISGIMSMPTPRCFTLSFSLLSSRQLWEGRESLATLFSSYSVSAYDTASSDVARLLLFRRAN